MQSPSRQNVPVRGKEEKGSRDLVGKFWRFCERRSSSAACLDLLAVADFISVHPALVGRSRSVC
jgi:hypothetical protein